MSLFRQKCRPILSQLILLLFIRLDRNDQK